MIGNAPLITIPAPAVYDDGFEIFIFGFLNTTRGSPAFAETNPPLPAQDNLAFYQVPSISPTIGCDKFGYIYSVDSGLCITVDQTSSSYPRFQAGKMRLEPCNTCNSTPPPDQLFCTEAYEPTSYLPYIGLAFFGDTEVTSNFYRSRYSSRSECEESFVRLDRG